MKHASLPGPRDEHLANIQHLLKALEKRGLGLAEEIEYLKAADEARVIGGFAESFTGRYQARGASLPCSPARGG